jgi:CheY-like chemotaxis protein
MASNDYAPSLTSVSMMLVVDQSFALDVLMTVVKGFSVGRVARAGNVDEALSTFSLSPVDVIIVDCGATAGSNASVVHRLRRSLPEMYRTMPIIVLIAHTGEQLVKGCMAAGASFLISKPYNSETLLRRLTWLSHDPRSFINDDSYVGPDRRTRNAGLPAHVRDGRRASDLPTELGDAGLNLDQSAIDSLFKPQKVSF